jgi:hypothetical protein
MLHRWGWRDWRVEEIEQKEQWLLRLVAGALFLPPQLHAGMKGWVVGDY